MPIAATDATETTDTPTYATTDATDEPPTPNWVFNGETTESQVPGVSTDATEPQIPDVTTEQDLPVVTTEVVIAEVTTDTTEPVPDVTTDFTTSETTPATNDASAVLVLSTRYSSNKPMVISFEGLFFNNFDTWMQQYLRIAYPWITGFHYEISFKNHDILKLTEKQRESVRAFWKIKD